MITELLNTLNNKLQNLRPDFYKKLNEGLPENTINELEIKYNRNLPPEVKELYKWKNGQKGYSSFVNNSCFIPLETVLKNAEMLNKMIGTDFKKENWWNKHWLQLFENGNGSGLCIDLEGTFTNNPNQIIEYWSKSSDRNVVYPNLILLLEKILEMYETDISELDEPYDLSDYTMYPKEYPKKFKAE